MKPHTRIPTWHVVALGQYPRLNAYEWRILLYILQRAYDERRPHAEFYLSRDAVEERLGIGYNVVARSIHALATTPAVLAEPDLHGHHMLVYGGEERFGAQDGHQNRNSTIVRLNLDWKTWGWPAGLSTGRWTRLISQVEEARNPPARDPAHQLARFLWYASRSAEVGRLPLVDADDPWWQRWITQIGDLLDRGYAYEQLRTAIGAMMEDDGWSATLRVMGRADDAFAAFAPDYLARYLRGTRPTTRPEGSS